MAWRIVKGPEDVTYPPSKPGVSWRYTLQSGDGREMMVTFDFAEISPDPAEQPELSEAVESSGLSVLVQYLEREGRPPSRFLVNNLGIHPSA